MSNKSPIDKIQLPQGGGAISGMGEKFSPDLFTSMGNFSMPIAVPPGRNGMQPFLSLGYSTGTGNSSFGLEWGHSVAGVMRSVSNGLPLHVESGVPIVIGRRVEKLKISVLGFIFDLGALCEPWRSLRLLPSLENANPRWFASICFESNE